MRHRMTAWAAGAALLALAPLAPAAPDPAAAPAPTPAAKAAADPTAAEVFAEARAICARDRGRFWGRPLCGPMLLVDWRTRRAVANQADAGGALKPDGAVFTGLIPASETITNSPTRWSGTLWTEILWPPPLPMDAAARRVMLAHELYHRIQGDVGMPREEGDNAHLDTLEGRYWLQLEWRALAWALDAATPAARAAAARDALAFRAERYRLFPAAAANERKLELNEGVAEYTGVRLGVIGGQAQTAYAVRDLTNHPADESFVRSFAYATGPAYGLLLDRYAPGWRDKARREPRPGLDQLLGAALPAPHGPARALAARALAARAAAYDGVALRKSEEARERARQARLATLRARFIDGPVLRLPTPKISYEFNPRAAQPLGEAGTVYPHLRVKSAFGVLAAENGALLAKDLKSVTVSAAGADWTALKGDGWALTLQPGWVVKPGARPGDFVVTAGP